MSQLPDALTSLSAGDGVQAARHHTQVGPKHRLLRDSVMDKVVQYVKDTLPSSHPLVGLGWTQLGRLDWELPDEVGMDDGEEGEEEGEE